MDAMNFQHALSLLVAEALSRGECAVADVVLCLEATKLDTIEAMRMAQARAQREQTPLIVLPK
jgi:hypothetical protein